MKQRFDPGYFEEPFRTLVSEYPETDVYPAGQFRVEWGPIFHRGRLDGSARVLIIGQDPAQHESIVRRILVGEAGRRVQGFLAKLGITTSYVMINTYLYSVYGSVKASVRKNPALIAYRNKWIDALMVGGKIEAVLALGVVAEEAWGYWKEAAAGMPATTTFAGITHPTQPESSSKRDKKKLAQETSRMLNNWNSALQVLAPAIKHPDVSCTLELYGDTWRDGDRLSVPANDIPAGLPEWMRENDGWARRVGKNDVAKRRNITIDIPRGSIL